MDLNAPLSHFEVYINLPVVISSSYVTTRNSQVSKRAGVLYSLLASGAVYFWLSVGRYDLVIQQFKQRITFQLC